jgi:hypothetical protein
MTADTEFDLVALDARDEADLAIRHPITDAPTTWVWTFYGPGHPKTVEVANRVSRDALRELAAQKQARVNGKKWKEEDQTIDQIRADNVDNIVARTKSFTPVNLGDGKIEFSAQKAKELLLDRKKGWLFTQVIDFLRADESFIQPSATS